MLQGMLTVAQLCLDLFCPRLQLLLAIGYTLCMCKHMLYTLSIQLSSSWGICHHSCGLLVGPNSARHVPLHAVSKDIMCPRAWSIMLTDGLCFTEVACTGGITYSQVQGAQTKLDHSQHALEHGHTCSLSMYRGGEHRQSQTTASMLQSMVTHAH